MEKFEMPVVQIFDLDPVDIVTESPTCRTILG